MRIDSFEGDGYGHEALATGDLGVGMRRSDRAGIGAGAAMDDGVSRRLAGSVAERVVREDHPTEVEEAR